MSTFVNLLDIVYPVGSVYLANNSTSPATSFGGTWSAVTGGCLAAAGTTGFASVGSTGGSTTISVAQMPSHTHGATRTFTTSLSVNREGDANFAMSGQTRDREYTWPVFTNATGGGEAYYPAHVSFNVWKRTA